METIGADPRPGLSVLVVEADPAERELMAGILEEAGHQVMWCPGPSARDGTCVGTRDGACPLADAADAVVLDTRLQRDDVLGGATGWQLALFYRDSGVPLVALVEPGGGSSLLRGEGVVLLRRPVSQDALLRALTRAVSESRPPA
jgi:CheY-like chemotaxis protein